ncbi:MAG: transglutaminase domain-containing protein [Burkholderiales bacterium]
MTYTAQPGLPPGLMIDADHPEVVAFARKVTAEATDPRDAAVKLYYAVRDGLRYDPYKLDLSVRGLSGSQALANGYGWCVPKAALLASVCRAVGIPARIGVANVRNHLSTARMREMMASDIIYGHGYTTIELDGQWFKATPAFNLGLCEKLRLQPLEFDGRADSIYHPYDLDGRRHMEYVDMLGEFDDVPRDLLLSLFEQHYPTVWQLSKSSWDDDVAAEAAAG